jgi:UDP-glucose-4-epimerase GalE
VTACVLVTGGAGYIGSHVCRALAAAGFVPVTVDNLSTGNAWAVQWGPFERGDIGDAAFLSGVFARHPVQAVMHLAGSALAGEGEREPLAYWRNNVGNGVNLLQAMEDAKVRALVFSSSCSLYGQPQRTPVDESLQIQPVSVYGRSKAAFESVINDVSAQGLIDCVSLRYFNAAGASTDAVIGEWHQPETHLIPNILLAIQNDAAVSVFGDDYATGDGTCVRDYVHVEDIAGAHLAALRYLQDQGRTTAVNIGSGRGYSVREVIAACERVTGRTVKVQSLPRRAGDPASLFADSARAREILGWVPQHTGLEQIVASAWHWLQSGKARHATM